MGKEKDKVIERIKEKAEVFLENNIKAFIKTFSDDYYFCDILFIGELYLTIYDFKRKENFRLYWQDIIIFDEFKPREEKSNEVR